MSKKEKNSLSNDSHPRIIDSKDKKIIEQKPPSEKIIYFNIVKNNDIKSENEEDNT
ncbi:MAG: hypothetical protein ACFE9N_10920 [Promethearchaeota archaeon]